MAKKNTLIKINGTHYDAVSGAALDFELTPVKQAVKSIDGVIGGSSHQPVHVHKPRAAATVTTAKSTVKRTAAKHATVKKAKPAQTLMRHAVSKPAPSLKRSAKVQHAVRSSHAVVIPKTTVHGVNHVRASRAKQQLTHPRVSHFKQEVNLLATTLKADVKQAAVALDEAIVIPQTYSPSGPYRPDIRRVKITSSAPLTSDIFEQALLRATSHEEPHVETAKERSFLRSLRRRMVSFSAGAVAVLAIVGFMGFQKQDTIQFKSAARSASFSATMPGYQPTGYSLDKVQNSGDTLYARYTSADKNYIVSQKPTSWGSQTLLEKIAANETTSAYSTVQSAGRTVYVYGRNQAAWVHNGVLYQVLGNGVLSTQDFTQIATSM